MKKTGLKRTLAITVAAVALTATAACSNPETGTPGKVQILASFYPLQFIAEDIGGDLVEVTSLTPRGAEPHDLELTPAMTRTISTTDLVVYLRGFQPSVDEAVDARAPSHIVDAAMTAKLVPLDDHGSEAEDDHDGHDHGSLDPHFWLDPTRMTAVADAVATQLATVAPEHAATFRTNAETLKTKLTDLDEEFTSGLATCPSRAFVTTHSAFGYLGARYDLEQIGISGIDPDAEPSPARLKEISAVIRDRQISTVFFETLASPKVAETLATDLGVETAVLDPLEALADASSDYLKVMKLNLTALQTALECPQP